MAIVVNPAAFAAVEGLAEAALGKIALDLEGHTKQNIQNQHLVDTGNLLGSVQASPRGDAGWTVRVAAEYAAFHEFGTVYISPRPFLRPAVETVRAALAGVG